MEGYSIKFISVGYLAVSLRDGFPYAKMKLNYELISEYSKNVQEKLNRQAGNYCDWCRKVVGTYSYPDVPKDVYRRHRYCRCMVEFLPGDGRRQNVHTKKWRNVENSDKIKKIEYMKKTDYQIVDKIVEKDLYGSEKSALIEYTDSYYGITNRYLGDRLYPEDDIEFDNTAMRVTEIDRVLNRNNLDKDLILYRGVEDAEFNEWLKSDTIKEYKSTSIKESVGEKFSGGFKIMIKAPKNTKGIYIGRNSAFGDEYEFLMHRNQKYKILSVKDNIIEVEFYE